MANTIRIKRSTGSSSPTTAENAELAFSEGNRILWYGIGTAGAGGTATSLVAIGGSGAFLALDGSLAQTITGVKTFSGATVLGTPGSGTLTNCTGLPLTTGITGVLGVANGGTGFSTLAAAGIALRGVNSDITQLTGLTTPLTIAQGGIGATTLAGAGIATLASPTFTGTLNCAALTSSGNVIVGGNLTVNGTTVTVNSTVTTLDDPILTLGGDTAPTTDDNKDRGIEFRWHNGTSAKLGFFGFSDLTGYLTFIPDATNTTEVFTGTKGDIQATNFRGALIGNADTVTTNANLTGHITSTGNTTALGSFTSSNLATALSTKTGTGLAVFDTSPTLVTPSLGAATALTVNKVGITAPATGSTLTIADGKTLTASNTLTFTGTDASSVAFGAGGTVVYTSGLGTNVATFLATPSSANLANAITDETGSGLLVFGTGPSLTNPVLSGEVYSTSATVTAGTNAIGQGIITADYNIIATTASNPSGVTLPKGTVGRRIIVVNKGTNPINVYPSASGGTDSIDALSIGASIQIPVSGLMQFNAATTDLWYSSGNSTFTAPALGTPTALVGTNITGTASGFTAGAVTNAGLTGEVTTSGLTATLSNSAVIGKVLTGFTSGAGTVAATDTILQAIQKINGNTSAGIAAAGSLTGATLASNVLASSLTSVGTLAGLTVTAAIVGSVTGNAGTVTTNANLTGAITSSGNTTSLGTASFTSANLAGALTDETGSGSAVFATSPTLVTPALGAATATSLTTSGDIAVNGGDITTTAATATLMNATATNLSVGGAATTLTMGATSGTALIRNAAIVLGNTTASISTTNTNPVGSNSNHLTIAPQGEIRLTPTNASAVGGDRPSVVIGQGDAAAGVVTIAGGDLYLSTKFDGDATTTPVNIIFEGLTANAFETTLTVTDPTADRTITLPNATGTVALTTDLSQFAATTSAQLAGIMSDETGSGALVFANTPTLIAPLLGTPTSGILTNCTGTASGLTAGLVTNGLYTTSVIDGGSY